MRYFFSLSVALPGAFVAGGQPAVTALAPARNHVAAPRGGPVTLTFSEAVSADSAGGLRLFSAQRGGQLVRTGPGGGLLTGGGTPTLSFAPSKPFRPGETLTLVMPPTLVGLTGAAVVPLMAQFTAATGGTGTGRLVVPALDAEVPTNNGPLAVATGDLDQDGDPDAVTANYGGGPGATLSTLLNPGNAGGELLSAHTPTVVVGSGPVAVALADVDADGDLDALTACFNLDLVALRFNSGRQARRLMLE